MIYERLTKCANHEPSAFQKCAILFVVGFSMIFVGIMFLMVAAVFSSGSADFGAFILIVPFPIVMGAGPDAAWMALFAAILAILSVIMFLMLHIEVKKADV
jgi:uncharacterized membrane protein